MSPRIRTRAMKVLKENINVVKKSKVKSDGKITKSSRKALSDKTNSLSDDNSSIDIPIKTSKITLINKNVETTQDAQVRPKRERRLPPRYVENQTLKNLSNSRDSITKQNPITSKAKIPTKKPPVKEVPSKTFQDIKSDEKRGIKVVLPVKQIPKDKEESSNREKTSKNADRQVSMTKFLTKDETCPKKSSHVQTVVENTSKDSLNLSSPFKTSFKEADDRPKRVCRLPSRFEDHSISPSKFIPIKPCYASTPIMQKTTKIKGEKENDAMTKKHKMKILKAAKSNPSNIAINTSDKSTYKSSPDTNNNGKSKVLRHKRATVKTMLQTKLVSPDRKLKPLTKRLLEKSLSFRVLNDNQPIEKSLDVYEFTFDPDEEPPPQKKKRKKPVKKRPAKPKTVIFKSNYNDNVSKALAHLKSKVKPSKTHTIQRNVNPMVNLEKPAQNHVELIENHVKVTEDHAKSTDNQPKTVENYMTAENVKSALENVQVSLPIKPTCDNISQHNYSDNITNAVPYESLNPILPSNYASIRVEDIAADFEFSDRHDDINYSPVNSPHHLPNSEQSKTVCAASEANKTIDPVHDKDLLHLQEDASFFELPIASSSMNISTTVRQPHASPWRVEFGSLPMKWHNNTYVKPNMTPAVGCSFVNSELSQKKHVYTNMLPEPLPEIFEEPAPALKQTSIISYIKEVAEKQAKKKKRRQSQTTTSGIYEDATVISKEGHRSPKKPKLTTDSTNTSNNSNNTTDKENSNTSNKILSAEENASPIKRKKNKDITFFGFDESKDIDQENLSPVKVNSNPKTRVLRSRNVLQELNAQPVPIRAVLPVSAKAKLASSEVGELYDQLKLAEEAQCSVPAKELANKMVAADPSWCEDEDSESVHLFEDIDVVHHLKPHRKSYGKAKKVTFQQLANSDSDTQQPVGEEEFSDDDDLADLSFHLPNIKEMRNKRSKKKKRKNKLLTKQEERDVEEWAAGFNSMCEDVDEFTLLVE